MISGEKIAAYIAQPQLTEGADIRDIAELIKKYPFCSSLYVLQLKAMALANDLDFERQLKLSSIHAHDREHLYQLIHSGEQAEQVEIRTETEPEVIYEITTEVVEKIDITPSEPKIEVVEFIDQTPTEKEAVEPTLEENELIPDIFNTLMDANFVDSEIEELPDHKTIEDKPKEEEKEIEPVQAEAKTEPEKIETPAENLTFSQWLRLKQKGTHNTTEAAPIEETVKEEKPVLKNTVDALLEKFIRDEPRISKPIKDFYNPAKNARQSIEESDDLVTETLAEIHVLQKNFQKAISAYEKLILLYPEKKTFFASRIEKIREEIKNK